MSRKVIITLLLLLCCAGVLLAQERKVNIDKGWRFHLGSTSNAEQPSFDHSQWRVVDLPHDWSVEPLPVQREGVTIGPFSHLSEGGADTGQTLGGEGWYRKEFTILPQDANKLFTLYFEGAYAQSEVWINGHKANYNPYGYTSFRVDVTPYCNAPGKSNVVAVKVVNVGQNSRWYAGSGIYRHVWMIKTNRLYLDEWDTFVNASELNEGKAQVKFSTILHNAGVKGKRTSLNVRILSPSGDQIVSQTNTFTVPASGELPVSLSMEVDEPLLWSVDNPVMYRAEVSTYIGQDIVDEISIPFGIRTISFSADQGFLLNGESLKLKGGCLHHDNGLLGAAAINRAEQRKVELLKANGYNAVRCSHNLPSEHFLDACDSLGMLVINETFDQWQKPKRPNDYHQFFDQWSDHDISTMVRRDRNHPSIIMWSIGNEIPERADSIGEQIAKRLVSTIQKYDDSRFTTAAVNEFWDNRHLKWDDSFKAFRNIDVAGYNYMWREYEGDNAKHPSRVMYGSESVPKEAAHNWNLVEKHPYIIGDFVWTAVDYLGEAGLAHTVELAEGEHNSQFMGWPWYNAWCGDIDLCGDKKPQSYYRDILWRERDISMAVQPPIAQGKREEINYWGWRDELVSWNWSGYEGQSMTVRVYSRCPKVRLYLDEVLLDEKQVGGEDYTASFDVEYRPGRLRAVNIENGREAASVELRTIGEPVALRLVADRDSIRADRNDLAYVKVELIDKDGYVVPDNDIAVSIKCEGAGSVIASGNASYGDMRSFRSLTPNTFRGRAIAILQPNEKGGDIKLSVEAKGLPKSEIVINTY